MISTAYARPDPEVTIRLVGASDIFRFAINMLSMQVEFCAEGRRILMALRGSLGADRFDLMAAGLLGERRHAELAHYWEPDEEDDDG